MSVAEGVAAPEDFLVEVWDTDSGLPHSTVTSIAQTPDGYLWVGTLFGGLARFDGVRFVNFHPGNTPELRSIEIQKLLVDSQGTLWVGTVVGALSSYRDGRFRFERQSPEMPQAWLGGVVSSGSNSVALSSIHGWLFRGTRVDGTNRWETFRPPDANHWFSLCADPQGLIWFRTQDGHLGQVRSNQFVNMPNPPGLRSPQINALLTDAAGQLWVGTEKELARWDGQTFVNLTPTNGEPDVAVRQMAAGPDGTLWVWTDRELRKCRGRQWVAQVEAWDGEGPQSSTFPMSALGVSRSIFADSRGGLWVLQYGDGLWHVNASGKVSRVREAQGLPSALVECWFEDREGNVWIGLTGGGLARVRERAFHTVWPTGGLTHTAARSICEDQDGTMWFGTSGDTLLRWRNGEFTNFTPPIEQTMGLNITVCPGGAGRLWVGSVRNGVVTLEAEKFSRPFPLGDIGTVARVIYKDRAGRIWIGSEFGLFCWEQGKLKRFTAADGFTPAYVTAITEDNAGNLWIGTALGDLRRYRAGRFTIYWPKDSPTDPQAAAAAATAEVGARPLQNRSLGAQIGGERFWALHADAEGVIWIGVLGGGLLRFHDGEFTRYTPREGLPNEHVSQILEDGRGQLWLGTRGGIVRVSKEELNQFARGETRAVPFITYGKFDGLPTVECAGGSQPACWRGRDGRLWFATVKGAVWVDPAELPFNAVPPPVVIEEILVDGEALIEGHQSVSDSSQRAPPRWRIPAGRHYLDFKFTALSLTSPDKVQFKWRLLGLEKDWLPASRQRSVSYSFVPPGDYEFQLQACNNDGVWSQTAAAIQLTVLPYFWQTWGFKAASGIGGAAVVGLTVLMLVRRRARRKLEVLERERAIEWERSRIARDIHDDLGSNLTRIVMLSESARSTLEQPRQAAADLDEICQTGRDLTLQLSEIVWAVNPEHDTLDSFATYAGKHAHDFLTTAGVRCRLDLPLALPALSLDSAVRHNVFLAFKEALNNAVRHAEAISVLVALKLAEHSFTLTVEDDGCGLMSVGSLPLGHGLANMKRRLAEVGGRCEIASTPASGTRVRLIVPLATRK
jgi:ligand-binding sensor domain-containing protein/signal transduction histidine kinase